MANIILKDKNGNDAIFEGVESVKFRTADGSSVKFSEGPGAPPAQEKTINITANGTVEVTPR